MLAAPILVGIGAAVVLPDRSRDRAFWLAACLWRAVAAEFVVAFVDGRVDMKEQPMPPATGDVERKGRSEPRVSILRRVLIAQRAGSHRGLNDQPAVAKQPAEDGAATAASEAANARTAAIEQETTALRAEILDLRERLQLAEALEQSLAAAQRQLAAEEAALAQLRAVVEELRAERDAARESERSTLERARSLEHDAAGLRGGIEQIPAIRKAAERAESLDREIAALRALAAGLQAESTTAEERAAGAEASAKAADARSTDAESRAASAEAQAARLEKARRETERRHAAELRTAREQNERTDSEDRKAQRREAARLAAEVESLGSRVAAAEDATAAALRELGVDPSHWPLTAAGVTRAVGPLTLYALGEDTPGWNPDAPEDTLAAAVLSLSRQSAERQRQVERLSSALARTGGRR